MKKFLHNLLSKKYLQILCIGFFIPSISFGQIVEDSIRTMPSSCDNNGSISIFAHSSNPPIVYQIVSGPVTEPVQTSNIFSSLPPGAYFVEAHDAINNTFGDNAIVTGNYIPLVLNPILTNPYCTGNSNGQIIGNRTAGTGNGPFTWQLIAPSTITTAPQASDTFSNLAAGNYTVRVTDACNNYATYSSTLTDPNTKSNFTYNGVTIEVIGCDSAWVTSFLQLPPGTLRLPLTYKYITKNGTYIPAAGTTIIDSTNLHTTGLIQIGQLVSGIGYGDSVQSRIFNTCGDSVTFSSTIYPYTFHPAYSFNGCGTTVDASFAYSPDFNPVFGFRAPATYSLVDVATSAVIDAGTLTQDPTHFYGNLDNIVTIAPALPVGETYTFKIKDGCGNVFTQNYTIPAKAPPVIVDMSVIIPDACIDSAIGNYRVHTTGFSGGTQFILLSGPTNFGSTKPKFAYADIYKYPDTLAILGSGDQYTFLQDLTAGTYQFKIVDTCGYEIDSFITIHPSDVTTSLQESYNYTKGCLGQNKIYYSFSAEGTITVRNIATNTILKTQSYNGHTNLDSILNVPTGTYELTIDYAQLSYGSQINNTYTSCWVIKDTLTIPPYQAPSISSSNSVICKGGTTLELIPDSTKGVPPYQYEIVTGPQTFPVQSSNLFPVTTAGIYQARISDACGNATTAQVTVDTITFPPVTIVKNSCNNAVLFFGSSIYYTYQWTQPNGIIYTGDTLSIDPITPADTGLYTIKKIIAIGGCKDTFNTTYHLSLDPITYINETICAGDTAYIGTKQFTTAGLHTDTLLNTIGCDSIVTLDIIISTAPAITISASAVTVSQGVTVQLNTTATAPYLWISTASISNNSIQDPTVVVNSSSWIYLHATSSCPTLDSIFIAVSLDTTISPPCTDSYIFLPTAFTPNDDGKDDVFKILYSNIRLDDFQIYNRWGQMVFETSDINRGWNGTFLGQMLAGNYVYWISYYDCNHVTTPKIIKGNIMLIR